MSSGMRFGIAFDGFVPVRDAVVIAQRAEAVAWREDLHLRGLRLAVNNGCFDLLHSGHAQYMAEAR